MTILNWVSILIENGVMKLDMLPAKSKNIAFQKIFECVYWIMEVDLSKKELGNKCKIQRIKNVAFQKKFLCIYEISKVDSGVNLGLDLRAKVEPFKILLDLGMAQLKFGGNLCDYYGIFGAGPKGA